MSTAIIFFAVVLLILALTLGVILKTLNAALNTLYSSSAVTVCSAVAGFLIVMLLVLCVQVIEQYYRYGLGDAIFYIITIVVIIGVLYSLVTGFGVPILKVAIIIAGVLLLALILFIDVLISACDKITDYSLGVIVKHTELT